EAVLLYDLPSGKRRYTLRGYVAGTEDPFSPDGKTLVARTIDGAVTLWDVDMGKEKFTLAMPPWEFGTPPWEGGLLRFTPDGKSLLWVGPGGIFHEWSLATGRETTPRTEGKTLATIKLPDTPEHRKLFALLRARRDTAEHVFRLRALNSYDRSFGRIGGVQP